MPTQLHKPSENRLEFPLPPAEANARGSMPLVLAGLAGIVLGFLGLAKVLPLRLDGLALVILGGGLVLSSWHSRTPTKPRPRIPLSGLPIGTERFTTEVVLSFIALVLGILALTRMSTVNLVALGVIALGVALWAGSMAEAQIGMARPTSNTGDRKAASRIIGLGAAIGVGAILLGVLSFLGVRPRLLVFISFLGVGCAILLAGTSVTRGSARRAA